MRYFVDRDDTAFYRNPVRNLMKLNLYINSKNMFL